MIQAEASRSKAAAAHVVLKALFLLQPAACGIHDAPLPLHPPKLISRSDATSHLLTDYLKVLGKVEVGADQH